MLDEVSMTGKPHTALGASRNAILRIVFGETLVLTCAGLLLGLPWALAAAHLLGHMLFSVSANDPATLAAVAFTLAFAAGIAVYIPARRAMSIDPMVPRITGVARTICPARECVSSLVVCLRNSCSLRSGKSK
jgi:hypothetical protein